MFGNPGEVRVECIGKRFASSPFVGGLVLVGTEVCLQVDGANILVRGGGQVLEDGLFNLFKLVGWVKRVSRMKASDNGRLVRKRMRV